MKEKMPRSILVIFAFLVFLAEFVFPGQASGQVKADKPKNPIGVCAEGLQRSGVQDNPSFCGSVGGCRDSEVQPCFGLGSHICVTIENIRYFCHDCSGSGECQKEKYCSRDSWRCERIKSK